MKLQKKIGAGLLALALVLSLGACSGSASSSTASSATASASESTVAESASTAPEVESSATSSPLDGIKFRADKVRNDATGNWRISCIAENIDMSEHALDYYKQYFTDDSEIHFIVNFNYNTTTKIMSMGDQLDVTVQDYVSKEEHDAKVLGSGEVLAEYFVDKDTGEIEKVR